MRRSKRFVIVAVLAAVILAGSIGGVVLATDNATDNGDVSQPEAQPGALLDRVCEIYEQNTGVAIDPEALNDAFAQVRSEMQAAAMEKRLDRMIEEGVIDEDQAKELQDWWEARPDIPFKFGFGPDMPFKSGFGGRGGFHGFGRPCPPAE